MQYLNYDCNFLECATHNCSIEHEVVLMELKVSKKLLRQSIKVNLILIFLCVSVRAIYLYYSRMFLLNES